MVVSLWYVYHNDIFAVNINRVNIFIFQSVDISLISIDSVPKVPHDFCCIGNSRDGKPFLWICFLTVLMYAE